MISGEAHCRRVLNEVPSRASSSRRCVIFDIDNTLVDTRYRTREAGNAFAAAFPELGGPLKHLKIKEIKRTGRETAQGLGLPTSTATAFDRFWEPYFWNPKHFLKDSPLQRVIKIAEAASRARIEAFYLTGRIKALSPGTLIQLKGLEQHGLPPVKASQLITKPFMEMNTNRFKLAEIKRLRDRGIEPLLFLTDSHHEIAAVQERNAAPCVLVDFPGHSGGPALQPDTPVIRIPRR